MQNTIHKISIVGHGNVGHHLAIELSKAGIMVTHIGARNQSNAQNLAQIIEAEICSIENLPLDQPVLLCVPDDEIKTVLRLINKSISVAYTSGSVHLKDLPQRENLGVFYPLQTFTTTRTPNMAEVPFFIESTTRLFQDQLVQLAGSISDRVNLATSEERKKMHVVAVMVNNFTNHILYNANKYSDENKIDFNHFLPLLSETVNKLEYDSPYDAQTGPARRGDNQTIQNHIEMLNGKTKEIYILLSESIKQTYSKE